MGNAPSYKSLLNKYNGCEKSLQNFFRDFPALAGVPLLEVSLAYLFLRIELVQNRILYCGVVKLHRAHSEVAQSVIGSHRLTRDGFKELYRNVYGESFPRNIQSELEKAEKVRDKVVHGKDVDDPRLREAIFDALVYSEKLSKHIQTKAGFDPFGSLRGFKGRKSPLDKSTTKWLLKGLGFGKNAT